MNVAFGAVTNKGLGPLNRLIAPHPSPIAEGETGKWLDFIPETPIEGSACSRLVAGGNLKLKTELANHLKIACDHMYPLARINFLSKVATASQKLEYECINIHGE